MATLVSPGVSVTVIDESQYASAGEGTIPLIFLATASNKLTPDGTGIASGTQTSGKLELVTSQRDLVQKFGTPIFKTVDGTVQQGSELNEYGLHAAYSYLGIANRAYVIRADIDLSQLQMTQNAPRSNPANGTYWFDIGSTSFGIFRANGNPTAGLAWDVVTPKLPASSEVDGLNVPLASYGVDGDIAIVTKTTSNIAYEKISGAWYAIGSALWKSARPTVALASVVNPTVSIGDSIIINGVGVVMTGTALADVVSDINGAAIPDVSASNNGNRLEISLSSGSDITISGSGTIIADLGLLTAYAGYTLVYAPHTSVPVGTHSGSIWVKITDPNFGAAYSVKRFSNTTGQFATVTAPFYVDDAAADAAYGTAKVIGSLYVQYNTIGSTLDPIASQVIKRWDGSGWAVLVYQASVQAPSSAPAAGTLWINDDLRVDIMVNDGNEWKGYANFFPATDPNGVQITSEEPTEQTDGTPLVSNDLWLDSDDQENYPALYRYNASLAQWELIDNTDQTTPFGIVFADARPNADGLENGSELNTDMLVSDYVDAGTPNPETFPAGTLLFNTCYSTYNVKEWNPTKFAGQGSYTVGAASFPAPTYVARWSTASGNQANGAPFMGRLAQHQMVVRALQEVAVANDDIRSEFVFFNLMSAPGYPELVDELQALNIDRKETAFIIADTPLRLAPNATSLNEWATNANNAVQTNDVGRTTRYTYSAEYYPHGYSTNTDGNEVLVPSSTVALRTYAYNDSVAYPWLSPAGTQRGVVQNASSVGYLTSENEYQPVILNQGQRDVLYLNNINPIAFLPNRGLVVYGDKTMHPEASALDRVNVARLICYLRYQLDQLVQPFLFQLNVDSTRQAAESQVKRYLGDLLSLGAITDFAVVCDNTNNTPERIDRNELWIDIAIVPAKSINFIYIPIRIRNTGEI